MSGATSAWAGCVTRRRRSTGDEMSSAYGKILAPVIVPAGGWNLVINDSGGATTVTVPAGTYATVYDLGLELQGQIQAETGPPTHASDLVAITAIGQCTITSTETTSYTWGSSDSDLYEALGFAGTESVSSDVVTATSRVDHGWWPGVITRGTGSGAGVISDTGWVAENPSKSAISGSGKTREIGPTRPPYSRDLRIGLVNSTEHRDRARGPKIFLDRYRYSRLVWVPDRDDYYLATSLQSATQGDPGAPYYQDDDDAVHWWQVTLSRDPDIRRDQMRPDYAQIGLRLNAEPRAS